MRFNDKSARTFMANTGILEFRKNKFQYTQRIIAVRFPVEEHEIPPLCSAGGLASTEGFGEKCDHKIVGLDGLLRFPLRRFALHFRALQLSKAVLEVRRPGQNELIHRKASRAHSRQR